MPVSIRTVGIPSRHHAAGKASMGLPALPLAPNRAEPALSLHRGRKREARRRIACPLWLPPRVKVLMEGQKR